MANNQNSVCRFSIWPNGFLDLIFPSSFQQRFQTEIFTKFGWYSWLYWTWWHQPNCSAITKLLVFYYLTNISDFIISYNCVKFLKSFLIVGRVSSIIFVLLVWSTGIWAVNWLNAIFPLNCMYTSQFYWVQLRFRHFSLLWTFQNCVRPLFLCYSFSCTNNFG